MLEKCPVKGPCVVSRPKEFQFIEFFAGSRMASRCVGFGGYSSTALDINDAEFWGYGRATGTPFDLLSDSGMVLRVC